MPSTQLARALLLAGAIPGSFFLAACSGEEPPAASASPAAPAAERTTPTATSDAPRGEPAVATPTKPDLPSDESTGGRTGLGAPNTSVVRPLGADGSSLLEVLEGPRLASGVDADRYVFGMVLQGTICEHTFELVSGGTEDLVIDVLKSTCGCAVAQVLVEGDAGELEAYAFGDAIPVGRRITFPAKLDTSKKSGHQNTRISIISNDSRGIVQLGMEADIEPFFSVDPLSLEYGQLSTGDVLSRAATIVSTQGTPVKLELLERTLPSGALYELEPTDPGVDGRAVRWDLTVTLGPELYEGSLARTLLLNSDEPIPGANPNVDGTPVTYQAQLRLSVVTIGVISHSPPYLSMGLLRPGQSQTRTVTLESHDEEFSFAATPPKVRVAGLVTQGTNEYGEWEYGGCFTTTIRPVAGKNAVEIDLHLEGMPEGTRGSFRGTLLIELAHPEKPLIPLVITGVCR